VRVWDAANRRQLHALDAHQASVNALAFQPGSYLLASADKDQALRFWDAERGQDLTLPGLAGEGAAASGESTDDRIPSEEYTTSLAFSPDGRRLVLAGRGQAMQMWDVAGRHLLVKLPEPNPRYFNLCVAFSSDGNRLFTADRSVLKVRDVNPPRLTPEEQMEHKRVMAWHQDQARDAKDQHHWYGVDFHLSKLIAELDSKNADWYARRGTARGALGRTALAETDHARAIELAPNDADVWAWRGDAYVYQKRWREAEAAFARAVQCKNELFYWYLQAIARLGGGDIESYRKLCQEILKPERFGATSSPGEATQIAYVVAPVPGGLEPEALLRLAMQAADVNGNRQRILLAVKCRAGKYREALVHYQEAIQQRRAPRAWEWLFRAMAYHHLKDDASARTSLERARQWIAEADRVEDTPTEMSLVRWYHWMERVEVHALLREADTLINSPKANKAGEEVKSKE
jgi:tetratricopeptide (TPR) repeat protein